jgi:transposase InsO family protein
MLAPLIKWYHLSLSHVGMTRLGETIGRHFYNPKLNRTINDLISHCEPCQKYKAASRPYGHLPPRDTVVAPWTEIHVDLIGPWHIKVQGLDLYFNALTIIDPVTNLLEIVRIDNKTADHVGMKLENEWLSRYPRPTRCIHDQGQEFIGAAFSQRLRNFGIKCVPTTVKNPQANAICERAHQAVGNVLRTLLHVDPPANVIDASDTIASCLATAMHAARAAASGALNGISPGAFAFNRDMYLDIPLIADAIAIHQHRAALVDERLRLANLKRISHDYAVGEQVLQKVFDPSKLEERHVGPYRIERVHVNGTLTIRKDPNVTERINIRRLKPFRS